MLRRSLTRDLKETEQLTVVAGGVVGGRGELGRERHVLRFAAAEVVLWVIDGGAGKDGRVVVQAVGVDEDDRPRGQVVAVDPVV